MKAVILSPRPSGYWDRRQYSSYHKLLPAVGLGEALGQQERTSLHLASAQLAERGLSRHPILFRPVMRGCARCGTGCCVRYG